MTDAVEKRYEEAVRALQEAYGRRQHRGAWAKEGLDAIGFRALLEVEEAARSVMSSYNSGLGATYAQLDRLRTALAARATEGEKM